MQKLFYPAIFHPAEEGGFWITFPDLPECMRHACLPETHELQSREKNTHDPGMAQRGGSFSWTQFFTGIAGSVITKNKYNPLIADTKVPHPSAYAFIPPKSHQFPVSPPH